MSDDEDDPFEQLDESVGDREGNPFEQFEEVEDASDDDQTAGEDEPESTWADPLADDNTGYDAHDTTPAGHKAEVDNEEPEPADAATARADVGADVIEQDEPSIDTGDPDDPFAGVGGRAGDPFEDDVFEEMNVAEMDPDEVWDSIAQAQEAGSVSERAERTYAEVSKHRYCEQCEFFSDPPDVSCSHDGTEILEFLDQETVRVVDCPVVAERKELEKHE